MAENAFSKQKRNGGKRVFRGKASGGKRIFVRKFKYPWEGELRETLFPA